MARKPLGFMQLVIIFGYSLFYAWYLTTFFGLFMVFPTGVGFVEQHLGQLIYFAASLIATEFFLSRFRKMHAVTFSMNTPELVIACICGVLLPLCTIWDWAFGGVVLPAVYVACAFSGFFVSSFFVSWDDLARRGYLKHNVFAHAVIFALGGAFFVFAMLTGSLVTIAGICLVFLFGSVFLLSFINLRAEQSPGFPVEPAVAFFKGAHHLDVTTDVVTIAFGFAFVLLYHHLGAGLLLVMAVAILADFILAFIVGKNRYVPFVGTLRICMAVVSVALIAFTLPDALVKDIALSVVILIWFVYRTINGGSLMELSARKKLSMIYAVARGKLAGNIGFLLGLGIGLAVVGGSEAAGLSVVDVAQYVALALVAATVVSALFLLPFDNESSAPGLKTLVPMPLSEGGERVEDEDDPMRERCKRLVEVYKLSPREVDVLEYLVKGRNAKHIADKLCISESTVKTHIANIYRKTDVHSLQGLLDRLDEV